MIDAAKEEGSSKTTLPGPTRALWAWLCLVVAFCLAGTRAEAFFAQPDHAPGQIAPLHSEATGQNYDGSQYDALDSLIAAKGGDDLVDVHRGVNSGHPHFKDATQGKATPFGGHDSPDLHTEGDTDSIFTSWTTDPAIAEKFATKYTGKGVVLTDRVPASSLKRPSEAVDMNESEVLRTGATSGASVRKVKR